MHLEQTKIRDLRLDRGWTQQQLADACGVSVRTVQRVEKDGLASLDTTAALVSVFEVERKTLLKVSDPVSQPSFTGRGGLVVAGLAGAVFGATMTLLLT